MRANQNVVYQLTAFCRERDWFPGLIGCTCLGSFFSSVGQTNDSIDNGYLIVAFCSRLVPRIPVRGEFPSAVKMRSHASSDAVRRASRALAAQLGKRGGEAFDERWVYNNSTALLFSTGSGHVAQAGDRARSLEGRDSVQFRECFAAGQRLLELAAEKDVLAVGGHASNNRPTANQLQVLYHSTEEPDGSVSYDWRDSFGAVAAFLPYIRLHVDLSHPYKPVQGANRLDVDFCEDDEFAPGRYFYVRRINGRPVEDFFGEYWGLSRDEVWRMARDRSPIPSAPALHKITMASTRSGWDQDTAWPNVPVWFEIRKAAGQDEEIVLRLVRAEYEDAHLYLMKLDPPDLESCMQRFMLRMETAANVGSLSFLCESRKYVLMDVGENSEAETAIRMSPEGHTAVGVYLNGENSVGKAGSIGYHNYSQVSTLVPASDIGLLPRALADLVEAANLINELATDIVVNPARVLMAVRPARGVRAGSPILAWAEVAFENRDSPSVSSTLQLLAPPLC